MWTAHSVCGIRHTECAVYKVRFDILLTMLLASFSVVAQAELPSIRFDRLTPLGASADTSCDIEIAGADIEEVNSLLFDHPGLSAVPVEGKDKHFSVTVAADVPPGTYDVRLVGRWGVSNPRLFAVTQGLQDVAEVEPNNTREQAQAVEINSAVNGSSDGNGEDSFRFAAQQGQRLVIDCQAGKLDSFMDATMTLTTIDGRSLASSSDYNGRDPLIDFVVPSDGEYVVAVYDLSYRGGYPYRLLITDKPHVETVSPRAVQAGLPVTMTALGRNLPQGVASGTEIDGLELLASPFTVTPPTDVAATGSYSFYEHPTDHSVLPTAATCTLAGFQVRLPQVDAINAFPVVVSETEVTIETEPNDKQESPQAVSLPLVLSGRFDKPRDADWFEIQVPENGQYALDVYCERIRGRADPYLVVVDDQGNRIGEQDDFGHRINAFDGHLRDPVGMINLNADRKYRVLVQDRYRRGGARYQYVLTIHKPQPDFFVAAIHRQNPGPGGTTIWKGGAIELNVIIHQRDGYNGEVVLTAENLPAGLHAAPTAINNNTGATFVLWADADAPDYTGPIQLVATGTRGDEPLRREVRSYARVWSDAGMNSSRPTREMIVAVRESAPYSLQFESDRVEVEAGQKVEMTLRLDRHWNDFKSEVTILPLSFPGGFSMPNGQIAAGATETKVTIDVQNNRSAGEYTFSVTGQAQVPFNKDPAATERPNTLVSLPSRPITLVVKVPPK